MIQRQMEAWKIFLHGRIAQEEGREEEGLEAIEQALEIDPDNRHFLNALVIARGNLGRNLSRSEEDLLAHVEQSYERLDGALASGKAEPQQVNRLKVILAELEGRPNSGHERTYVRGLHC